MAAPDGIEPPFTESKSVVFPLNERAMSGLLKTLSATQNKNIALVFLKVISFKPTNIVFELQKLLGNEETSLDCFFGIKYVNRRSDGNETHSTVTY